MSFVPLRLHSDFSLLQAMVAVEKYPAALKELGYTAAGLADFQNAFGWIDFYSQMKSAGLKPILGTSLEICLKEGRGRKGWVRLYVKSNQGYENLCKILSAYSFQTLSLNRLIELQKGLILLISADHPQLEPQIPFLKAWDSSSLYIEATREPASMEKACRLEAEGFRCVATEPVFYLNPEDHLAHEVLLSIGAGTTLEDEKRPHFQEQYYYLKSPEIMEAIFAEHPEWITATQEIADSIEFSWNTDTYHIPQYQLPEQASVKSTDEWLQVECERGLEERLKLVENFHSKEDFPKVASQYRERLKEEIAIIQKMRFSDYFLVVSDFIKWSKANGIPVGPGRGSGAGSLAAYCLKITDIDPVRYTLLFERFLNPERVSMPDFDVDFCIRGRDEVINYVRNKYNLTPEQTKSAALEDNLKVAQIITFGKMKSKAVIRDVGRAMGMPYGDVDAIAKLIPNVLNITLADAFAAEPEFQNLRARDPRADRLLQIAERLEGLNRHASVHAAGVVIADDVLTKYIPLYKGADNEIITQFEMKGVEKLGLLKFDFLGLRNLTVIDDCLRMLEKPINLLEIDYSDPKVMEELSLGDTVGIFQLESSGMRDVIRRLKPTCFEDIIAIVALYRPGPLEGGMVDDFILRKQGKREVVYDSPVLEPILKETYGVFVYQEQVMKTANVMAGFSLGEADLLRRAMGKKKAEEMAKQREKFVSGAMNLGHPEALASSIFDLMSEFAKYGFNKSHAAAYAMVTVQTAHLKTYYPEAFYAALLSSESEDTEKLGFIIRNAQARGIRVLPPHVNHSDVGFSLDGEQGVRFGLGAVKNFGKKAAEKIVEERKKGPFESVLDFFKRAPLEFVNRRQAECLVRSGALDGLGMTRAAIFASLDSLLSEAEAEGSARRRGQGVLFAATPKLKQLEEWNERIRLNDEKHLLGTYMTGHPLQVFDSVLKSLNARSIQSILEGPTPSKDVEIQVAGLVVSSKEIFTKKGTKMAFLTLEDRTASIEVVVFSDLFEKKGNLLVADRVLVIQAQVSKESEVVKLLARDIQEMNQVNFTELRLKLREKAMISKLSLLADKAKLFPGEIPIKVHIPISGAVEGRALKETHVVVATPHQVRSSSDLISWLESEFGKESVSLV